MNGTELFNQIRTYCEANADEAVVKKYGRFFKEGYDAYGLTQELMEDKIKTLLAGGDLDLGTVLEASIPLVESGKYEETGFAVRLLSDGFAKQFDRDTFEVVSKWFDVGIVNWAHTDVTCSLLTPKFLEHGIVTLEDFSEWRTSGRRFKRRAVPVTMLALLKTEEDYQVLFDFIDPMMMDGERVVHQGLGWFLREAWKLKREETEEFLFKWKDDAARLIFQYATEKMSKEERVRFRKEKK